MEKAKIIHQLNVFYNMQPDSDLLALMFAISDKNEIAHGEWARPPLARFCRS